MLASVFRDTSHRPGCRHPASHQRCGGEQGRGRRDSQGDVHGLPDDPSRSAEQSWRSMTAAWQAWLLRW